MFQASFSQLIEPSLLYDTSTVCTVSPIKFSCRSMFCSLNESQYLTTIQFNDQFLPGILPGAAAPEGIFRWGLHSLEDYVSV